MVDLGTGSIFLFVVYEVEVICQCTVGTTSSNGVLIVPSLGRWPIS